jgi:hypothetical protein
MKQLITTTLLFFSILLLYSQSSFAQKIEGNYQVCPGATVRYVFNPQTGRETGRDSVWWTVKQNGQIHPYRNITKEIIEVTWTQEGTAELLATGFGCCLINFSCAIQTAP